MKKPLLYLLPALFLAACAQSPELDNGEGREAPLTSDEAKFLAEAQMPAKFDAQEIDRIVNAIEFPDNNTPGTRSSKRTVTKITPLTGRLSDTATRSGDGSGEEIGEEELFYAVDFGNDDGFAVISADRRLPDEVIINVGSGRFPEGEIENPGFALMMVGAENYARREIAKYEAWRDSMEVVLAGTDPATRGVTGPDGPHTDLPPGTILLSHTPTYEGPWITDNSSRIAPMVPVEWGQKYVFNDRATSEKGADVAAGCVGIATVQLMALWKYPSEYHDLPIDWNTTIKYTGSQGNRVGRRDAISVNHLTFERFEEALGHGVVPTVTLS